MVVLKLCLTEERCCAAEVAVVTVLSEQRIVEGREDTVDGSLQCAAVGSVWLGPLSVNGQSIDAM